MGVYKTSSIGVGRKSVGENTYKTVRGRTIVSSKITTNKSRTPKQVEQRKAFAVMGEFSKIMAAWIDKNFDQTKYGSPRNQFMKRNAPIMAYLKTNKLLTGTSIDKLAQAIKDGQALYAGFGANMANATFTPAADGLSLKLVFSRDIMIGDILTLVACISYTVSGADGTAISYPQVRIMDYVIKDGDIGADANIITLNKTKIPALDTCLKAPTGYTADSKIYAASILSGNEKALCFYSGTPKGSGDSESPDEI